MPIKERAIKDLCQLSDVDLFAEIAVGIGHVIDSVNELETAARKLYEIGHNHPGRVLGELAAEEAAKVLILVDVVRCPSNRHKERSRTLGHFYDHLAKGIYARASEGRWEDFAEVERFVNYHRSKYYLEGPTGVDWIFPNYITQGREDNLYVGYIRDDQGEHYWAPPQVTDSSYRTPTVIDLARTLHRTKATSPEGLSVIAEVWRPVELRPEMRWLEEQRKLNWKTLAELQARGKTELEPIQGEAGIWDDWHFPLWPLDLRQVDNLEELKEIQERWVPDWI